jgi:hypothetical protein
VCAAQEEEEESLLLMMATLTHSKATLTPGSVVEAISSRGGGREIELKEEKVYTHLDEEK